MKAKNFPAFGPGDLLEVKLVSGKGLCVLANLNSTRTRHHEGQQWQSESF